jgi:hypothetical protein
MSEIGYLIHFLEEIMMDIKSKYGERGGGGVSAAEVLGKKSFQKLLAFENQKSLRNYVVCSGDLNNRPQCIIFGPKSLITWIHARAND